MGEAFHRKDPIQVGRLEGAACFVWLGVLATIAGVSWLLLPSSPQPRLTSTEEAERRAHRAWFPVYGRRPRRG